MDISTDRAVCQNNKSFVSFFFFSRLHFNMKILTVYFIDSFLFYHLYSFSLHRREVLNDSYMKTNNLFMFCTCTPAEVIFLCAITNTVITVVMGFKWNMNYWRWACGWGVCNCHSFIKTQGDWWLGFICPVSFKFDFDSVLPKSDDKQFYVVT